MVGIWILMIVFFIGGIVTLITLDHDTHSDGTVFGCIMGTLVTVAGVIGIIALSIREEPKPKAIDVYRGKTTLQITYQDSVALDSTVVWKPEFKPED